MNRDTANKVAAKIFEYVRGVLKEAKETGRLDAFVYSGHGLEAWLVCEVYSKLWQNREEIKEFFGSEAKEWGIWKEILVPGEDKKHFDLFFGLVKERNKEKELYEATPKTPCFEFKLINHKKKINNVRTDIDKLTGAGIKHGYLIILYQAPEGKDIDDLQEGLTNNEKIKERIESLPELDPCSYSVVTLKFPKQQRPYDKCFRAEIFRVS